LPPLADGRSVRTGGMRCVTPGLAFAFCLVSGSIAACGGGTLAREGRATATVRATAQRAADAGAGDVVAGVPLVAALGTSLRPGGRGSLREDCRRAARRLGFPVPCPARLPEATSAEVATAGACPGRVLTIGAGCDGARRDAFASRDYPDPVRPGHLVVFGSPRPLAPEAAAYAPAAPPGRPDAVLARPRVHHERATALQVAPSSESASGGHVALIWRERGHSYLVSVHGRGRDTLRLALAIARSVRLVGR
jgi:hypothetical protein